MKTLGLTCVVVCVLVVGGLGQPKPILSLAEKEAVEVLLQRSPQTWSKGMPAVREILRTRTAVALEYVVNRTQDGTAVPGLFGESQIHSVCGNALTLLERLTTVHVCGLKRKWIGFNTHDHRGQAPSEKDVRNPWKQWLAVREPIDANTWFWGLSYAELEPVVAALRMPSGRWDARVLAPVRLLGKRVYPYLIDKLGDDGWGAERQRLCDQANRLLGKLTGHDAQEIPALRLLALSADDPRRRGGLVEAQNQANMRHARETWLVKLLAPK
ncbi:MAG: hypothetical protein CMJ83_01775 [Planctomycetes bacterium]|nr:hypothetical protein [Planctomycetota bacterium]